MNSINGKQLYGLKRVLATLKISMQKDIRKLPLKKKLALAYVAGESKLTELNGKIYSNTFTPYFPSPAYDRYIKGVIATSEGNPVPIVTNFAVTARCPCRCWHCSFSSRKKKDELSLKELKKAIAEVQNLGAAVIGITGGEPLLRNDLEDIIASIDERSMPLIFTTGFKLSYERVRSLKDAGLAIPVISVDHYNREIHDKGRGRDGFFNYAVNAIEMFKSEGFYVAVSFVPDKRLVNNRDEIFKVIDFFKELGVNDMRLTSPILSGKLTDRPDEKLSPENIETIFDIQKKCVKSEGYPGIFSYDYFERKKFYGCCAGYNYMFIDSMGNVSPCDFTMLSFGNVTEKNTADIWKDMNALFALPGTICYANRISPSVAEKGISNLPLNPKQSEEIVKERAPYDIDDIPLFYKKMGIK